MCCCSSPLPAPPSSRAVYIDDQQRFQRLSRTLDPAKGWYTVPYQGAPQNQGVGPNAPFDMPFYLIL